MIRYLDTGRLSDFEIECKDHIFKVHKVILASKSGWFKRLFEGEWKVSTSLVNSITLVQN